MESEMTSARLVMASSMPWMTQLRRPLASPASQLIQVATIKAGSCRKGAAAVPAGGLSIGAKVAIIGGVAAAGTVAGLAAAGTFSGITPAASIP